MSVLSQKLQEAAKLFQSHSFKKSLEAYQDCLDFCKRTKEEDSVIFNILSTKATLEYILGEFDKALVTLNSVLTRDHSHFLCLLRRSQVYKKNKLRRALKDLSSIQVYCPDNLQISAFKIEVQHLLLVQGSTAEVSSDSSEEQEEENQQISLNFANLKLIDRKSSDLSAIKQRKSRVTILGDTTYEYKKEEEDESEEKKEEVKDEQNISDKALRTFREIQLDGSEGNPNEQISIRVSGPPKAAKRSILKNKGTSIFVEPENEEAKQTKYLGRQSKLLSLLKSIDGRFIHSGELEHESLKEVVFRKSVSQVTPLQQILEHSPSMLSNKSTLSDQKRKSCLKRASFQLSEPRKMRRSKFEEIDASKIDGKLLIHNAKPRHSIENKPEEKTDVKAQSSDSDNDSSSHNIFGSRGVVMTPDLKQKLGLQDVEEGMSKSLNLQKKMSILKKNSSVIMSSKKSSMREPKMELPLDSGQKNLKAKKSVMFNCTL